MIPETRQAGRKAGKECTPVPRPTYFDGSETPLHVIYSALLEVRAVEPYATSFRTAEWVNAYLTAFASLPVSGETRE